LKIQGAAKVPLRLIFAVTSKQNEMKEKLTLKVKVYFLLFFYITCEK